MGKFSALVKFAAVAGPAVVKVVQKYGPTLTELRKSNPEVFDAVQNQVRKMAEARKAGKSPEVLHRRIAALRDQVAYLRQSADDEGERQRAEDWRVKLDKIEASLPLLSAMSSKAAARERAHIDARIDELSSEILSAYIDEQEEDARQLES
ncbi:hypothetical protein ATJ97_0731 [Georgenia soli]|uniref:Uncharacterized protein n=1 Tax=Georgenia soli TaxID=638953 RepID=A0A2A9EH77_9MICO|nr:hypothetical protein [Georgenia soli]PFG38258.1 hypothetical protein ATJ97_0731 [Georgenia soli]